MPQSAQVLERATGMVETTLASARLRDGGNAVSVSVVVRRISKSVTL